MHAGTFERRDSESSCLEGQGAVTVTDVGLQVQAGAVRTTLVTLLSGFVAVVAMVCAVVVTLVVLDELDAITDGDSLRPAVVAGIVAVVGTFLTVRAISRRVLPLGRFDALISYRYIVTAAVQTGVLHMVSTAPTCSGRIEFRTTNPVGLLRDIERAKGG